MKKFFIGIAIILVLAIAGIAVFLSTFDLNRYRPMIVKQASEALGAPVSIGRLSLVWNAGLAVSAERLAVYPHSTKEKPIVSVDKASVTVRLMPLLKKEIQVASVFVTHPVLHIQKLPDGRLALPMPAAKPATPGRSKAKAQAPSLAIDSVTVDNAEIEFLDNTQSPPRRVVLRDTDARVKNFSLTRPFSFSVRSALFSEKPDLSATGTLALGQGSKPPVLKKLELNADLGLMNLNELKQFSPEVQRSGLERVSGTLTVSASDLSLDQASLAALNATLRFDKGSIALRDLRVPVTDIQMRGNIAHGTANIDTLTADLGSGKIKATAKISNLSASPLLRLNINLENLLLAELAPHRSEEPGLDGVVTFHIAAQASSADLTHTLTGSGDLALRDGVIRNFNVVQDVFSRISIIPGITDTLMQRLPDAYKQKITSRNTALMPVDLPFNIVNGTFVFNNLKIQTDHFVVLGAGQSDMAGQVLGQAAIQISPELSNAFQQSVAQLSYFMNPQGQIEIPFRFEGRLPRPKVLPDMDALAPKLAAVGTQEILGRVLSKVSKNQQGSAPAADQAAGPSNAAAEDPLASLLKKALS